MTNRMIWQKASFYLIWKCADWVASDMEPRCDQHSRGNWGHQLIKPSRVVKGKPPFFPVLFFYQDPLIIKLPLFMNTSLRARRKAIRRLCVGKSVKVCVYQTMLGTACDRLCPAHQGKTSYRCLVAYNRAEVGWGEVVCQCHTFKASKHWNNFYEFACMGEFNCAFCPTCDLAISQSDIFHPGHQLPLTLKTLLYCCSWTKQKKLPEKVFKKSIDDNFNPHKNSFPVAGIRFVRSGRSLVCNGFW